MKLFCCLLAGVVLACAQQSPPDYLNHNRPVLDAHNCYPYDGKWADRIDRAISTGFPVGIEQDIAPYTDPKTGEVIAKVTHRSAANAADPTLQRHFFEHVRPIIEHALQ